MSFKPGWALPDLTSKCIHYFARDNRSLCGRWTWFGWTGAGRGTENPRCKTCERKAP